MPKRTRLKTETDMIMRDIRCVTQIIKILMTEKKMHVCDALKMCAALLDNREESK